MSALDQDELAARVQAAILATPGVRTIYRSGSLISNLVESGAAAVGLRAVDRPVVVVRQVDGIASVDASIGIEYSTPARDVLHAVRAAIAAALGDGGSAPGAISLTIAYVHPRETA